MRAGSGVKIETGIYLSSTCTRAYLLYTIKMLCVGSSYSLCTICKIYEKGNFYTTNICSSVAIVYIARRGYASFIKINLFDWDQRFVGNAGS